MKTLSLETCKKLNDIVGNSVVTDFFWHQASTFRNKKSNFESLPTKWYVHLAKGDYPAYQVQDILSRPFLEALGSKLGWKFASNMPFEDALHKCGHSLLEAYWQSQEALEEELLKLIEK